MLNAQEEKKTTEKILGHIEAARRIARQSTASVTIPVELLLPCVTGDYHTRLSDLILTSDEDEVIFFSDY